MALACTLTCLTLYSHAWPFDAAVVRLGFSPVGSAKRVDSISGPETFSREMSTETWDSLDPGGEGSRPSVCHFHPKSLQSGPTAQEHSLTQGWTTLGRARPNPSRDLSSRSLLIQ